MMWPDVLMAMSNMENIVLRNNISRTERFIPFEKVNFEFGWNLDQIYDDSYMLMQTIQYLHWHQFRRW